MTGGRSIALGIAAGLLVLSIVVAIVLIPVLDEQLRRANARRTAAADLSSPADRKVP